MQLSPPLPDSAPPSADKTSVDTPLLPPLLLGPGAFLWFWILPIAVLGLLNLQGYSLIEGNMSPVEKITAHRFGVGLVADLALGIIAWIVGLALQAKGELHRVRHPAWAIGLIALHVAYLWASIALMDTLIPVNVRSWLYPEERFMWNQFAFGMLPLFLGILRLAAARTADDRFGRTLALAFAAAFGAPLLLYVSFNLLRFVPWEHAIPVIVASEVVLCGIVMFIGLIRALLFLLRAAQRNPRKLELGMIGFLGLVFPLCGLWLNTKIPFPVDLQTWEVYALVVANAGFLFRTSLKREYTPGLCYALLCFTLPFSLYFFVVFLPFTPLSILAVIFFGAGFLVLSPVLLFALQLHLLNVARKAVLLRNRGRVMLWLGSGCFLILPILYTARGLADRAALHAALDYVYAPSLTSSSQFVYSGNRLNLRRALSHHRDYKNGVFYPLLSPYYSWLVFDNLVLPDDKLARLESTFFGGTMVKDSKTAHGSRVNTERTVRDRTLLRPAPALPRTAEVKSLSLQSHPSPAGSQVTTLRFTLANTSASPAEYVKALPLPAGVFVRGFRLEMNGEMVPARIFERKTAAWVYSMIRDSERRDPGLLLYTDADHLELRVFPVTTRPIAVEIDFLTPANIDSRTAVESNDPAAVVAALGKSISPTLACTARGTFYLAGEDSVFPAVEVPTYLHLVIDRSQENGYDGTIADALRSATAKYPSAKSVRVTVANYEAVDVVPDLSSVTELLTRHFDPLDKLLPQRGGLALDLAVSRALRQHLYADLDHADDRMVPARPIIVLFDKHVSKHAVDLSLSTAWAEDTMDFQLDELDATGEQLTLHAATSPASPLLRLGDSIRVLTGTRAARFDPVTTPHELRYWSPEAKTWAPASNISPLQTATPWLDAVALSFAQQDFYRSPGTSVMDAAGLIKASRAQGILIRSASYIAVENSAQWKQLELSEKTKLGQNSALEFKETPAPSLLWLAAAYVAWLCVSRRRIPVKVRRV